MRPITTYDVEAPPSDEPKLSTAFTVAANRQGVQALFDDACVRFHIPERKERPKAKYNALARALGIRDPKTLTDILARADYYPDMKTLMYICDEAKIAREDMLRALDVLPTKPADNFNWAALEAAIRTRYNLTDEDLEDYRRISQCLMDLARDVARIPRRRRSAANARPPESSPPGAPATER